MSSIRSSRRRSFICRSSSPRSCARISSGSLVRKRTRLPGVRVMTEGGFIVFENVSLFALHPLPRPDDEMQRTPNQPQRFAELIVEIAPIRKMERLIHIREQRERRRCGTQLRAVVEAARASFDRRRLMLPHGALEDLIELLRAEAPPIAIDDPFDARKDFFDAAAALRGDELE